MYLFRTMKLNKLFFWFYENEQKKFADWCLQREWFFKLVIYNLWHFENCWEISIFMYFKNKILKNRKDNRKDFLKKLNNIFLTFLQQTDWNNIAVITIITTSRMILVINPSIVSNMKIIRFVLRIQSVFSFSEIN